jgi:phosphoribosylglycinamide formyltransferase 1
MAFTFLEKWLKIEALLHRQYMNICVLASTNGTALQAIIEEIAAGKMKGVDLKFVLTNKERCGAAKKAQSAGVPLIYLDQMTEDGEKVKREVYDQRLLAFCEAYEIELIVLVGWMRLISADFVKRYKRKIINIHPSLLPKYPGMDKNVHKAVLDSGDTQTGMTIHYVDSGMDTGEIILQKTCSVKAGDTVETLKSRVQALEKEWYPKVIWQLSGDFF